MDIKKLPKQQIYGGAIVVIAALVIIYFVFLSAPVSAAQTVVAGDNISVYYTGMFPNGTIFDSNVGRQPLNFTVGAGQLIMGFDQGVIGMHLNQNKTITVPPAEGYGMYNQSLVVSVPISVFGNQTAQVGMIATSPYGQQGRITAVNATNATVDFNSPLANKTLIFTVDVVKITAPGTA